MIYSNYGKKKFDEGKTNSKGRLKYKSLGKTYNYPRCKISLSTDIDKFDIEANYYYYKPSFEKIQGVNTALFLDRAIYRPGQLFTSKV